MPIPTHHIYPDLESLSEQTAVRLLELAQWAVARRGQFTIVLSGGSTPLPLYRRLAQAPYLEQFPWANTHFFWGDERCVPPDSAESNYGQAHQALLQHVPVPPSRVHRVRGEWPPERAAADYAAQLQELAPPNWAWAWPRFDVVLLGLGSDGHIASLFPHAPLPPPGTAAWPVAANYGGRPAERITLTPAVFNNAREIWVLVVGAKKAAAVAAVWHGDYDPYQWPAQRLQPKAGQVVWLLDEAAAVG